jgi:PKD repeat protein
MGKEPLTVKFLDLSTGTVTGWLWDFGDGMTSTNKNPTHTFHEAGTYQVQLEATGPVGSSKTEVTVEVTSRDGSRSTSSEKNMVSGILGNTEIGETDSSLSISTGKPMANFTISRRNGPSPLVISFEDHSTGEITRWNWDFGDNSISDLPNPTHTYEQTGVYTVSLMVEGPDGRSSKRIRDAIDVI